MFLFLSHFKVSDKPTIFMIISMSIIYSVNLFGLQQLKEGSVIIVATRVFFNSSQISSYILEASLKYLIMSL